MPDDTFYAGLGLTEALRKFANHHYDPDVRHISLFEYQLLEQAARRIAGVPPNTPVIDEAAAGDWTRLLQAYWTGIASRRTETGFDIWSVPLRSLTPGVFGLLGFTVRQAENALEVNWPETAVTGSPERLQSGLLAMLAAARAPRLDLLAPHPPDAGTMIEEPEAWMGSPLNVAADDFELVNRALYQPSVPIESSPPAFKSVQDILAATGGGYMWLAHIQHEGPLAVVYTGTTIIVIRVSLALADRLAEGIYNWRRPKDQ